MSICDAGENILFCFSRELRERVNMKKFCWCLPLLACWGLKVWRREVPTRTIGELLRYQSFHCSLTSMITLALRLRCGEVHRVRRIAKPPATDVSTMLTIYGKIASEQRAFLCKNSEMRHHESEKESYHTNWISMYHVEIIRQLKRKPQRNEHSANEQLKTLVSYGHLHHASRYRRRLSLTNMMSQANGVMRVEATVFWEWFRAVHFQVLESSVISPDFWLWQLSGSGKENYCFQANYRNQWEDEQMTENEKVIYKKSLLLKEEHEMGTSGLTIWRSREELKKLIQLLNHVLRQDRLHLICFSHTHPYPHPRPRPWLWSKVNDRILYGRFMTLSLETRALLYESVVT